jgi:hypothetical protein
MLAGDERKSNCRDIDVYMYKRMKAGDERALGKTMENAVHSAKEMCLTMHVMNERTESILFRNQSSF